MQKMQRRIRQVGPWASGCNSISLIAIIILPRQSLVLTNPFGSWPQFGQLRASLTRSGLDIDLVNFARKLPSEYKFRNGQTKYILKKALEPVLPSQILYRKKQGFAVPISQWFADTDLIKPEDVPRYTLNAEFYKNRLSDHIKGKGNYAAYLWSQWSLDRQLEYNSHP